MTNHYNSATDKLNTDEQNGLINQIIIAILGLATAVVLHHHLVGVI